MGMLEDAEKQANLERRMKEIERDRLDVPHRLEVERIAAWIIGAIILLVLCLIRASR